LHLGFEQPNICTILLNVRSFTTSAAITASLGRGEPPKVKVSPVEWFVADEPETHTRYFVIQGSDNFDHWKVNLTFDPMVFEDPALGVKVLACFPHPFCIPSRPYVSGAAAASRHLLPASLLQPQLLGSADYAISCNFALSNAHRSFVCLTSHRAKFRLADVLQHWLSLGAPGGVPDGAGAVRALSAAGGGAPRQFPLRQGLLHGVSFHPVPSF